MGNFANLIMKYTSEHKSLREVCLDYITTINEGIIREATSKQIDLLKSMGKPLEKELPNLVESSRVRDTLPEG